MVQWLVKIVNIQVDGWKIKEFLIRFKLMVKLRKRIRRVSKIIEFEDKLMMVRVCSENIISFYDFLGRQERVMMCKSSIVTSFLYN